MSHDIILSDSFNKFDINKYGPTLNLSKKFYVLLPHENTLLWKIAFVAMLIIPVVGLMFFCLVDYALKNYFKLNSENIKAQIDRDNGYEIRINGETALNKIPQIALAHKGQGRATTLKRGEILEEKLNNLGLSNYQKQFVLNNSHQGVHAKITNLIKSELIKALEKAPLFNNDSNSDIPLSMKQTENTPNKIEYNINYEGNGIVVVHDIKNGSIITSSKTKVKCSVLDLTLDNPTRVIFEFDVSYSIHLETGQYDVKCILIKSNPITGSIEESPSKAPTAPQKQARPKTRNDKSIRATQQPI